MFKVKSGAACQKCNGTGKTYKEETHENKVRDALPPFRIKKVTTKIRRPVACDSCSNVTRSTHDTASSVDELEAIYERLKEERLKKYYNDEDQRQWEYLHDPGSY